MAVESGAVAGPQLVVERVDAGGRDPYEDLGGTGRRIRPLEELLRVSIAESLVAQRFAHGGPLLRRQFGDDAKLIDDTGVNFHLL